MIANSFHSRRPRGAVLLLVLGAVAILSILAVEISHRSKLDVSRSSRMSREAAFRRVFSSGTEIAKGLLAEGRKGQGFDFAGDQWSKEISITLDAGQRVTVRLSDESGKINLLKATDPTAGAKTRKSLARLFAYLRKSDSSRETQWEEAELAIRKRLGIDEKSASSSAPSPIYTLDALREAGISRELIFGNLDPEDKNVALCDLLTAFGDGRININTAPAAVLYSIDEEYSEQLVNSIDMWRGGIEIKNNESEMKPFKSAKDLESVEGVVERKTVDGQPVVVKNLFLKVQDRIDVQSRCFSARIDAQVDGRQRTGWAFFEAGSAGAGNAVPVVTLIAFEEIEP